LPACSNSRWPTAAKIARMMQARANALTPRPAGVVTILRIDGRKVLVQRRARRAGFALAG
jgi:hypothetical protein